VSRLAFRVVIAVFQSSLDSCSLTLCSAAAALSCSVLNFWKSLRAVALSSSVWASSTLTCLSLRFCAINSALAAARA
jgi:hypothetical protein